LGYRRKKLEGMMIYVMINKKLTKITIVKSRRKVESMSNRMTVFFVHRDQMYSPQNVVKHNDMGTRIRCSIRAPNHPETGVWIWLFTNKLPVMNKGAVVALFGICI